MMLPEWSLQQLAYLREVARCSTWTEAAERLGVTQPALSQGLGELERRLGVDLFERRGRNRVLTEAARPLVALAERVLVTADDLAAAARQVGTGSSGPLRLGMIDVAALHTLPGTISRFRDAHPAVELRLVVAPSAQLVTALRAGELDLAVAVRPDVVAPGLDAIELVDEELRVYAPESFPGRRAPSTWGPWAMYPDGSTTRRLIEAALHRVGAPLDIVSESANPEVLRQMVRLGLGWAVLPQSEAESGPEPLRPYRRQPLTTRSLVVLRRSEAPYDPRVEAFLTLI
jgi:DNA-binding transcriptional LysR family regulator